jgi:hypothetical protein
MVAAVKLESFFTVMKWAFITQLTEASIRPTI